MVEVRIELYDKREKCTTTLDVDQLSLNKFRMIDNDLVNYRLTLGTEFETRINKDNRHEVVRITKESDYITRRFHLSISHKESEYRMLGDELTKLGGFWQVDLSSIATINIPKNIDLDIDRVIEDLGLNLSEIMVYK